MLKENKINLLVCGGGGLAASTVSNLNPSWIELELGWVLTIRRARPVVAMPYELHLPWPSKHNALHASESC